MTGRGLADVTVGDVISGVAQMPLWLFALYFAVPVLSAALVRAVSGNDRLAAWVEDRRRSWIAGRSAGRRAREYQRRVRAERQR
jgi:hypothetical protein